MPGDSPLSSIDSHFDVLIIGGGITGAGIFRDLSLHGFKTLLIDKKDFSSQTSQSSSKMLHGGIRYLENFDFKLVWEALHEKNLWLKLTPHLCYEEAFHLPIYKDSIRAPWMIKAGMMLYDLLSSFQNSPHKMINKNETLKSIPELKSKGLKQSGIYFDGIVDDAKLTLEVIYDGLLEKGCKALNYTEFVSFKKFENHNEVIIRDTFSKKEKTITVKELVFATGPFTDKLLAHNENFNWTPKLVPSKGSHLWLDQNSFPVKHPLLLTPKDGRVIFVIPQKGRVLVGTTETESGDNFFDLVPSEEETKYLIKNLKEYFPEYEITEKNILAKFSGIRPLVKDENSTTLGKTAREHKVYQPLSNVFVILGGKYTTFRVMAQDIVRPICHKHKIPFDNAKTQRPLRQKSSQLPFEPIEITKSLVFKIVKEEKVRTFRDLIERRLDIPSVECWKQKTDFNTFWNDINEELKGKIHLNIDEFRDQNL